MNSLTKKSVLFVGCADGRVCLPADLEEALVHRIQLPGGVLNPQLPRVSGNPQTQQQLEEDYLFQIITMVSLKNPDEIVLASHHDCGAANGLGLSIEETIGATWAFKKTLSQQFPYLRIRVLHENHSKCGEFHHGHEQIDFEELPLLQEAAQMS